jgi:hypothetical protein
VSVNFHLLTSCAASDIILDKDRLSWPLVITLYEFESLELAGVSRRKSVVVSFYNPFM